MSYKGVSTISQGCELGIVHNPEENAVHKFGDQSYQQKQGEIEAF